MTITPITTLLIPKEENKNVYMTKVYPLMLGAFTAQSQTCDEADIISLYLFYYYFGFSCVEIHRLCSACYTTLEGGQHSDILFSFLSSAPSRKMQNTCV